MFITATNSVEGEGEGERCSDAGEASGLKVVCMLREILLITAPDSSREGKHHQNKYVLLPLSNGQSPCMHVRKVIQGTHSSAHIMHSLGQLKFMTASSEYILPSLRYLDTWISYHL